MGWELFPHFLVRNTTFPVEWVGQLGFAETASELRRLVETDAQITAHMTSWRDAFPAAVRGLTRSGPGARTRRHVLALRRRVAKRKDCRAEDVAALEFEIPTLAKALRVWNDLVRARDEHLTGARAAFPGDLARARAALGRLAGDVEFQHAVFLSSPHMLLALQRYAASGGTTPRTWRTRVVERKVAAYLQRLCAKNERGSFFGPVNFGEFVTESASDLEFNPPQRMKAKQNEVFMAYWGIAALIARLAREPSVVPHLRPRRNPVADVVSKRGRWVHSLDSTVAISETQRRAFQLCDGSLSVERIAQRLELPLERAVAILRTLETVRLITLVPEIPPTLPCPLPFLRELVRLLPNYVEARGRWLVDVEEVERLRRVFTGADLPGRVEALAALEALFKRASGGVHPQRGKGQFYSDRLLLYEECHDSHGPFRVGGRLKASLLDRLRPALDLWAAAGCARWKAHQEIGLALFDEMSPSGEPVPYLRFQRALARVEKSEEVREQRSRVDEGIRRELGAALVSDGTGHRATLPRGAVEAVGSRWKTGQRHSLMCSPDVFLSAASLADVRAGRYRVVVGDVHDDWTTIGAGACSYFHRQRDAMVALQEKVLLELPDGDRIATILPRRRHKDYCAEPPGVTIELSGLSVKPRDRVVPFSAVDVGKHDNALMLRDRTSGRWLRLCTGDARSLAHWVFSWPRVLPVPLGPAHHMPRVELDGLVLQRERWRLSRAEVEPLRTARDADLMIEAWRLKEALGLPRCVFVLPDNEPKPVFVDFSNFFLVEVLQEMVSRSSTTVITEMLPGPDELWLRDQRGRYCAELRLGVTYFWEA